ncbi:MAG: adenylyltransferase/cytidyltransferase family protein [Alphaproteobacteria bacterium]|nr:adenylyltransferase/cytidyltransferase family protein [Alphaproteobacteria bacterium]
MNELSDRYRHKVKTAQELRDIIGPRPRKQSVVMCHGVFDLVHPGHIRHLIYAKAKADILVASLTADRHITKSQYRPFVPQDLRALNLAALDVVDYVLIDERATPLDNLGYLQPDFFAKGYEYQDGGLHPRTQQEHDIITSYGGEMIFTPGDIVYSSSTIIETVPPNLTLDKLLMLMEAESIDFDRLRRSLRGFEGLKVHVVGDTIVDTLTYTTMIGGMTKTPTASVRYDRCVDYIGGAAIVAKHLRAAGAEVTLTTVLGDDRYKDFVLEGLAADGIECRPLIDKTRPTTHKNAIVCDDYRLLKIDTLDNRSISDSQLEIMTQQIARSSARAIVFSDFRHGIFNRRTIPHLTEAIPPGVFRVADSQVASRWGNILDFKGFDLVTPNEREARFALADQDTGVRPLSAKLHELGGIKTVILKLGDRGVITCRGDIDGDYRSFFVIDSFVERLVDAVGAGDALLAYATLTMLSDGSEVVSSIVGSLAAALECEADGNVPITPESLLARIDRLERRARFHQA